MAVSFIIDEILFTSIVYSLLFPDNQILIERMLSPNALIDWNLKKIIIFYSKILLSFKFIFSKRIGKYVAWNKIWYYQIIPIALVILGCNSVKSHIKSLEKISLSFLPHLIGLQPYVA